MLTYYFAYFFILQKTKNLQQHVQTYVVKGRKKKKKYNSKYEEGTETLKAALKCCSDNILTRDQNHVNMQP